MKRKRLPVLAIMLCVVILGLAVPAEAAKVKIKGVNFVADTFCGVPAYYDQIATITTSKWQCTEYVRRFYRDAYGLSINSILVPIMLSEGYDLKITQTPKPGDIFHSPALRRGKTTDHTAIVKSYSNGVVTLIEQNHRYNGYASVNRTVSLPDRAVDIYTPVGIGRAAPQLKNSQGNSGERAPVIQPQEEWEIGQFGVRKVTEPAATKAAPTAMQTTEPETTTQTTAATAATTDALVAEFVMKEIARAEAAQQYTTVQAAQEPTTPAAAESLAEKEPARNVSASALAVLLIALLAAGGFGGVFWYKKRRMFHRK